MRFSIFSVADFYPQRTGSLRPFYAQLLDQMEQADKLGFDVYFIAEHHFSQYGVIPSPAVFLAAAAQRTERIGLGIAVVPLPLHNPLHVAEEYAMVDVLSGGRLNLGIGSGYLPYEFAGFNIGPWEKRHRLDEAMGVIEAAWCGGEFTHHGLYHHCADLELNVLPEQSPVPIWVAILRSEAAFYVGRQGRHLMMIPYASVDDLAELGRVEAEFRRGRTQAGLDPDQGELTLAIHTFISDDGGFDEAEAALTRYLETRLYARTRPAQELRETGLLLFGTPEQVTDGIVELHRHGMNHLMACCNFGDLEAPLVRRTQELLATEVMPQVQLRLRGSVGRRAVTVAGGSGVRT